MDRHRIKTIFRNAAKELAMARRQPSTDWMENPGDFKECPHCNGYGSSLKEECPTCTRCGGSGVIEK